MVDHLELLARCKLGKFILSHQALKLGKRWISAKLFRPQAHLLNELLSRLKKLNCRIDLMLDLILRHEMLDPNILTLRLFKSRMDCDSARSATASREEIA
ncbi:hypothetical protein XacyCFBP1159_21735 [Xanthomonas arboricola pv. corylina]|nr:hypothetical protein XacyCFBP1159_21735 [Xanthomonas arboricola pv. corylina]